jgi:hypothetical protein
MFKKVFLLIFFISLNFSMNKGTLEIKILKNEYDDNEFLMAEYLFYLLNKNGFKRENNGVKFIKDKFEVLIKNYKDIIFDGKVLIIGNSEDLMGN